MSKHIAVKHTGSRQDSEQETPSGTREGNPTADILVGTVNETKTRIREVFVNTLRSEIKAYQCKVKEESTEFAELQQI